MPDPACPLRATPEQLSSAELDRLRACVASETLYAFAKRSTASTSAVTRALASLPVRAGSLVLIRGALAPVAHAVPGLMATAEDVRR
jgi:hypothetical protein